jgi:hypothetical protein
MSNVTWGISYHTNGQSPRAKRWYRVARFAFIDCVWFEVYWHPDYTLRGYNLAELRKRAKQHGTDLYPGLFRTPHLCSRSNEMEHIA